MKTQNSNHISDEVLAAFIDNNLEGKERDDVMQHLVKCDECREVVMEVSKMSKEHKKKYPYANVLMHYVAPLAVAASLLLLIMPMSDNNGSDGLKSPNQQRTQQFRSILTEDTDRAIVIDNDDYAFCPKDNNNTDSNSSKTR